MTGSIFDYWQAIVGLVAIIGVFFAWRQWRGKAPKTENTIEHGSGNAQTGGEGDTVNKIIHGDNNQQGG